MPPIRKRNFHHPSPLGLPGAPVSTYRPGHDERNIAHWRINGHPATIVIWTTDEWDRLPERPLDAQYYPCGIWCALRMDPG